MPNSSLYVCSFGQGSKMDWQADKHTRDFKTNTPVADAGFNEISWVMPH